MARTLQQIQDEIKLNIRLYPELDVFLFPEDGGSQVSVFNLIIYVVSLSMYTFEVLLDSYLTEITNASQEVPVGNPQWVRKQMLLFQYGDTILLGDDFIPYYATVDPSLRIVTQCTVQEEFSSEIKIKVAKTTLGVIEPLTAPELSALSDYYYGSGDLQGVGFAGVRAEFISQNPDRIAITGNVYYLGQYVESTVETNVIAAINDYLSNLSFDGVVVLNDVVTLVNQVPGVDNFIITNVVAREWDVLLVNGESVTINGEYETIAGYIISEDTPGATLINTINMVQA